MHSNEQKPGKNTQPMKKSMVGIQFKPGKNTDLVVTMERPDSRVTLAEIRTPLIIALREVVGVTNPQVR